MRLSTPTKNKKATPSPPPAKKTQHTPAAAAPLKTTPAAKHTPFSISALTKKKNMKQASCAPPAKPMEQEPAMTEMSAKATREPVVSTPRKSVPVTENVHPALPDRHKTPAEIGKNGTGAQTPPRESTFSMTGMMTKKSVPPPNISEKKEKAIGNDGTGAQTPLPETTINMTGMMTKKSVPPPNISKKKEKAVAEAPPNIMESAPPLAAADSPADANVSHYNEAPASIYEACRQFGITVPKDRSTTIEQAKSCLITFFKKILQPSPEKHMLWPMIKSIASDIEGFVATDTAILNVLHCNRINSDKLVWHCIYTSILAMGIGKNEKKMGCSLYELGGAALLHDVGLLTINNGYDNIEGEKDPDCSAHVTKGVELARKLEVPEIVVNMIALHHGRLDGKGFPEKLSHSTFGRCSQILAIANMAELAVCELALGGKEAGTRDDGESSLAKILKEYRHAFDINLLKNMISLVGFYPVGSMVELNNRIVCKVVRQNTNFPLRPVIQVVMDGTGMHPEEEKLIDLKEVKILSVIRTLASPEIKK